MRKFISLLFVSILILTPFQLHSAQAAASVDQIRSFVEDKYIGEINGTLSSAETVEELMNMLDIYSDYYTFEQYEALTNSIEQKIYGLGIRYEYKKDVGIYIVMVYEDSSSYKAGIRDGDIIIEVNDNSVTNIDASTISSLLAGPEGSTVKLKVQRANGEIQTKIVQRAAFTVPVVTGKLLYGNIGYISVSSFALNTAIEVKSKAIQLTAAGATSFILDFQNNGGGYVQTARQFVSMFPNTVYAYLEVTKSSNKLISPSYVNYKLPGTSRLLINRNSASASEMLAASLKDQKAAIIYGERSYGKGIIQSFFSVFEDGSIQPNVYSGAGVLKLTTNEFRGPSGTYIHKVGVTPNKVTTTPLDDAHLDAIVEKYASYQLVKTFTNVEPTKTFTITFNRDIQSSIPLEAIEFVDLGGEKIETSISIKNNTLTVIPKQPLILDNKYAIVVHPKIKGANGKSLQTGYYAPIQVRK